MTSFAEWKELPPVRETVRALVGIDVRKLASWDEYKNAVFIADRKLHARAEKLASTASTGEFAVLTTTLATMDYSALAIQLEHKHDPPLLSCWQYAFGDYAEAIAGAMNMGAH